MRAAIALLLAAVGCAPPATHALTVRNLEGKCALIYFSGCAAISGERAATDQELDATQPATQPN